METELSEYSEKVFNQIEMKIPSVKQNKKAISDDLLRELIDQLNVKEIELNSKVREVVNVKGREQWKNEYERRWDFFKREQRNHWTTLTKEVFESQVNLEHHVERYKQKMRFQIHSPVYNSPGTLGRRCNWADPLSPRSSHRSRGMGHRGTGTPHTRDLWPFW